MKQKTVLVALLATMLCYHHQVYSQAPVEQTNFRTAQPEKKPVRQVSLWKTVTTFADSTQLPRFKHYYELNYGLGLDSCKGYLGFSFTHVPQRLGFGASAYLGLGKPSLTLLVGPAVRITPAGRGWQAFAGVGLTLADTTAFSAQAGVRYAFDRGYLAHTDYLSLSASLGYIDRQLVPMLGVSVAPASIKMSEWWDDKASYPSRYFSEALVGFCEGKLMLGTNFAYVPSKLGFYGSGLFGNGHYCANVGPVLRLTSTSSTGIDVQVFQGIGINSGKVGGETGIRLACFNDGDKYGMWTLSTALNYSDDYIGVSFGLSWPTVGIVAVVAGIAIYSWALVSSESSSSGSASSGGSASDGSKASSSGASGSSKCPVCQGSGNCTAKPGTIYSKAKDYCHGSGLCQSCQGTGWLAAGGDKADCPQCDHGECRHCKGSGKCSRCGGKGTR